MKYEPKYKFAIWRSAMSGGCQTYSIIEYVEGKNKLIVKVLSDTVPPIQLNETGQTIEFNLDNLVNQTFYYETKEELLLDNFELLLK